MSLLKPGVRLKSAVCDTQIIVVKALAGQHRLTCGGAAMLGTVESAPSGAELDPALCGGSLVGKRYADEADQFEFLCTKGGKGSLVLDDKPLRVKPAKTLPSSD
jgi:hypothetical protein